MANFFYSFLALGVVAIPLQFLVPELPWWKFFILLGSAQVYSELSGFIDKRFRENETNVPSVKTTVQSIETTAFTDYLNKLHAPYD